VANYTRLEQAEQALERIKCQESFAYFVHNYCTMWTKEGGDPIPFHLWEFQRDACGKFQNDRKLIVLKARQMGMSWLAMAYVVWCVLFTANFHVYITSIGLKEVNEQMERIRFIYYNLPDWLQGSVILGGKGCKDNDSLMELTNGAAVHAISSSKSGGHGAAPGLYILDEFSRKDNDIMAWRAIKPSLGNNSRVIIISTSNGFNNVYAELWFAAKKGENDFSPVFYSAADHPDYTPEYLADMRNDFAGDLQGFKEAFPMSPDEAFMSSSRAVFDAEIVRYWKQYIKDKKPEMLIGMLEDQEDGSKKFIENEAGHLMLWRKPVKGHRYTIGVDVAEGLVDGDYSVALVYDDDASEVVGLLRGKYAQEVFAYPVEQLGRYFNNAWIVVEVNKGAELIMSDLKTSYQWLYTRLVRENIWDKATRVPGFYTSSSSKPRIIMQLRRKFADTAAPLKIYSDVVLKEVSQYEQNEKGQLGAPRGEHDDCVMALALAIEGATTAPYQEEDAPRNSFSMQDNRSWRSL
jgi:hypothetical protein